MTKAEKQAARYTGYCRNKAYEDFLNGYHQAIEDACEWIKQQQEMLDDCFSDAGDFADLLKQAMEE